MWRKGFTADEILNTIKNTSFETEERIKRRCELSLEELRKREQYVDVKILDVIEKEYMKKQLFYTFNHPIDYILYIYTNRILQYLGYDKSEDMSEKDLERKFGNLKNSDCPTYPCVIDALKMEEYEKYFYTYTEIDKEVYDFDEYIKEYINRC